MKFLFYKLKRKILIYLYKYILIPKFYFKTSKYHKLFRVKSIKDTALKLINSNKSLGRFGDGEIEWILGNKKNHISFEKNSKMLSNALLRVLQSHNNNFLIGLPDAFYMRKDFTTQARLFWKIFFMRNDKRFLPLLNRNIIYYNTSVTRPYIDYNNRRMSEKIFKLLKKVWDNKNILFVEGNESRVGADDDLFDNVRKIRRIECPVKNAFESYHEIKNSVLHFLRNHKNFLVLISLGPTATILSFDLSSLGYRAIDIGHLDLEYTWYLIGAKEKINVPYKYVNENKDGHYALPEKNKKYYNQIIKVIK